MILIEETFSKIRTRCTLMRYTAEPRHRTAYYGDFRQRIVGHVNSRIEARTIFRQYIQIHQFAWHLHNILKTNLGSRLGHPSLVVGVISLANWCTVVSHWESPRLGAGKTIDRLGADTIQNQISNVVHFSLLLTCH